MISDDRLSSLAHLIHQELLQGDLVEFLDRDKAHHEIKRTLVGYFKVEEEADRLAREKIASLKRGVAEGSREWEVLHRKYVEEELSKKGR